MALARHQPRHADDQRPILNIEFGGDRIAIGGWRIEIDTGVDDCWRDAELGGEVGGVGADGDDDVGGVQGSHGRPASPPVGAAPGDVSPVDDHRGDGPPMVSDRGSHGPSFRPPFNGQHGRAA